MVRSSAERDDRHILQKLHGHVGDFHGEKVRRHTRLDSLLLADGEDVIESFEVARLTANEDDLVNNVLFDDRLDVRYGPHDTLGYSTIFRGIDFHVSEDPQTPVRIPGDQFTHLAGL